MSDTDKQERLWVAQFDLLADENDSLRAKVAQLEAERDALQERVKLLEGMEGGEYRSANRLRAERDEARAHIEKLEADLREVEQERDMWSQAHSEAHRQLPELRAAVRAYLDKPTKANHAALLAALSTQEEAPRVRFVGGGPMPILPLEADADG